MAPTASKILQFTKGTSPGEVDIRLERGGGTSTESETGDTRERLLGSARNAATAGRPQIIPLMDFGDALRLRYPLFVVMEESDGAIVAASYDLDVAEYGVTEFEALAELKAAVAELYLALKEMGDDAPAHLAAKRRFLDALALER